MIDDFQVCGFLAWFVAQTVYTLPDKRIRWLRNHFKNDMLENRRSADSHILDYRPDIDGLRAIAVIAVIIYHLSRGALPGGYLGVDIFFVLSGYLITSIIRCEIAAGDFSVSRFYVRRIRRIMPALIAMLSIATLASALILLPSDLVGFARSLLATLGFAANIYFWRDTNYFSSLADEKPLLHLWSLGIEEQYYLVFPWLMWLLAKKSWLLPGIGALFFASLALNLLAPGFDGYLPAFYLLPTRAWELGAGALIALLPLRGMAAPKIMAFCGYAGASLIAVALATGPRLAPSAATEALFVVSGTALIIYSGSLGRHPVNRLLAASSLVFVGLISYSLYLWHWPILVLSRYFLVRDLTVPEIGIALLLMFAAATVSWRFIERPFRESTLAAKSVVFLVFAAVSMLAVAAGTILCKSGFPERFSPAAQKLSAASGSNYRCAVSDYLYFNESRACALELPSRDPQQADLVLFGNSHALMYAPVLREIVREHFLSGLLVSENACLPTYGINLNPSCARLTDRNIDGISKLERARVVVIGTTWDGFVAGTHRPGKSGHSAQALLGGLDRTIDRLISSGKKVVLIGPIATPGWDVASIAGRNLAFGRPTDRPLYSGLQQFQSTYSGVISHFEQRRDIVLVRPDLAQCAAGRCDYVIDGRSLFADEHHLAKAELGIFRPGFETVLNRALAH